MDAATLLQEQYTNPRVIEAYSTVGLFPAEEKMVAKYFPLPGTVLDIGCGAGRTTIALAQKGYSVTGIDLMPKMIHSARRQAQQHGVAVDFRLMDVTELDFPRHTFQNAIFAYNGFEQIPGRKNRALALRKIYEVLTPGGCFILTSRSGLSFRRSLGWLIMALAYPYQRLAASGRQAVEFGDKLWGEMYCHYLNPFRVKADARALGFEVIDFNSEENVHTGKPENFFTHFYGGRMLFYVLRKPAP